MGIRSCTAIRTHPLNQQYSSCASPRAQSSYASTSASTSFTYTYLGRSQLRAYSAITRGQEWEDGAIDRAREAASGISVYSQNSEKPVPTVYQFFFRISNGWDDLVGEGEKGWSCWLPVNLDDVASADDDLRSEFYKLQPIQRLLVQIVHRWPGWKRYCAQYHVSMDISNADSLGIAFLVGGGKTGKAKNDLSPITWPEPPNQYTTLGEVFRAYNIIQQVTLGISVIKAQFITRDALVKRDVKQVKKEASIMREMSLPAPEVKIKTEPVFELKKRTTALSNQLEFVDLTGDDSSDDNSLPELSEVLSGAIVKLEKGNQQSEVVIKPEPTGRKREGSLSTYQPPGSTTKRSKPAKTTKSTKPTKSTSSKSISRQAEESEEEAG